METRETGANFHPRIAKGETMDTVRTQKVIRWQRITIRVLLVVTGLAIYKACDHDMCRLSVHLYQRAADAAQRREAQSQKSIDDLTNRLMTYEATYGPLERQRGTAR
jgi:hypothetical protein